MQIFLLHDSHLKMSQKIGQNVKKGLPINGHTAYPHPHILATTLAVLSI